MLLQIAIFLLALLSGFIAFRLGRARKAGDAPPPVLLRAGTLLAYAWLALSALLFAWAAARLLA